MSVLIWIGWPCTLFRTDESRRLDSDLMGFTQGFAS